MTIEHTFRALDIEHLISVLFNAHAVIQKILPLAKDDPAWEGRSGAYFCLADSRTGNPLLVIPLGVISPEEKANKYLTVCLEKARRLATNHWDVNKLHQSSWESRNPDEGKWGGAIIVRDFIFSMSGLPELGDEFVMIAMAARYFDNAPDVMETLKNIAKRSNNQIWLRALSLS